ncbi:prepilin-type N-terminal cleavage/methylation domain-containing protein [Candidatus Weimeria sp. HCP3S3_B5]|uniref:prepilin-type N-terminal cleavage/methylation domain-containing protein n=1 Tax=Candidatus Weimeria sp. HCP3S3_B5 TaxID=3438871 RepID=UPI003F8C5A76
MNTKVAKKNNKGFTLIELIVVIAIIAVLAAILAPQYLRYVEKSRVTSDESTAKEIKNAVQTACADDAVFTSLPTDNDTTVEWTPGEAGSKNGVLKVGDAVVSSTSTGLAGELYKTIKDVPNMKSKKWQKAGKYTVKVSVDSTDSSVSLSEQLGTP